MPNAGGPPIEPGPATVGPVLADAASAAPVPANATPAWSPGQPVAVAHYPVAESDRFTRFVTRLYARSPRWTAPVAALGCMAAAVGYTLLSNPTTSDPDAAPTCLLKLTTGLDCPGCGGTRAMWYILHGDLPAAARHHVIWVFVLPFLLYLYVAWAVEQSFGWRLPQLRITPRLLGGVVAAWLAFSVARNLPWAPFTSLYV